MNNNYNNLLSFHNNSNICYLNSCLQLLFSSDKLIESLENYDSESILYKIIMDIIKKKKSIDNPVYNSLILKTHLSEYNNFFKQLGQQDCHECFVNIIDTIHSDIKNNNICKNNIDNDIKLIKGNTKQGNDMFYNSLKIDGNSPFTKFLGQIRSELKCTECEKSRYIYETFNNIGLSLPQKESVDIIDCFLNYIKEESLDELIECEHCKEKTKTRKIVTIWRFPDILVLHLKRYTQTPFGHYTRNNCLVDYSVNMTFKNSNNNYIKYKLKSIVNHIGFSPLGGHYTTFVSNLNKIYNCDWIHIDDSDIYKISNDKIINNTAYMLLYEIESIK
jgi:ubiquitin carboxyl-terminal hydrolase 2/21